MADVRWFRRRKPETVEPSAPFVVQMQRVERVGEWPVDQWRVAGEWEPIKVSTRNEAVRRAQELRSHNKWGGLNVYPQVTITSPDGLVELA